jgi:hypothetical protein
MKTLCRDQEEKKDMDKKEKKKRKRVTQRRQIFAPKPIPSR